MKTIYAIATVLLAAPSSLAVVIPDDKATPELRQSPNDTLVGTHAAIPRAETDPLTLQAEPQGTHSATTNATTEETFVDSIIIRALRDRSVVEERFVRRLRTDLSPCFQQGEYETEKELTQCLRTVLALYSSPEELTKREKRRIVRRARHYSHADRSEAV